jgi:beta-lactamase regulating signal transducer with metallopeptidase domain
MPELLPPQVAGAVSAWLVTYAVHGTVWLSLAWLATAALRRLPDGFAEGLWKLAVLGPVLTATVQLGWGPAATQDLALPLLVPSGGGAGAPVVLRQPAAPAAATTVVERIDVSQLVAAFGLGGALLALARGWWLRLRLHRALGARRRASAEVAAELEALAAGIGFPRAVRASVVPGLATPIAFGVLWPEVCLPERALRDVDAERRRGMLAHELAHLQRGDPLWLYLFDLLQRAFFWQPLLRVARARLQVLAEYRCDALAARWTSPTAVAGGLLEVAGWIVRAARSPQLAPAMAARGSALKLRVDRLLDGAAAGVRARRWPWAVGLALLAATIAGLPGMPLPAAPAAAASPVPPPAAPAPPSAWVALYQDRAALRDEVAGLQADLRALGGGADAELRALLHELERRLQRLDRKHAALLARVAARQAPAPRPSASPEPVDPETKSREVSR